MAFIQKSYLLKYNYFEIIKINREKKFNYYTYYTNSPNKTFLSTRKKINVISRQPLKQAMQMLITAAGYLLSEFIANLLPRTTHREFIHYSRPPQPTADDPPDARSHLIIPSFKIQIHASSSTHATRI